MVGATADGGSGGERRALQSNRLWFNCHAAGAQNLLLRLCARARAKWDCCPHTGVVRHQYRPTVRHARRVYARLMAWAEKVAACPRN